MYLPSHHTPIDDCKIKCEGLLSALSKPFYQVGFIEGHIIVIKEIVSNFL